MRFSKSIFPGHDVTEKYDHRLYALHVYTNVGNGTKGILLHSWRKEGHLLTYIFEYALVHINVREKACHTYIFEKSIV